ncbi:hepatitis A virus cellular receptor 1 homolog [Tachysurus fulvidraco]|uniref:hepatitis A virus cellular receptor 1 homolog n=1 Tax=Tachysurus fulvidraco TaxID=1234273 RepID=UPI001FF06C26|nr:hepatitis A virus cellular receptor 1 homolog [Tachysurus fulvidraco]
MLTSVVLITLGILVVLCEGSILTVVELVGDMVTLPCEYDVSNYGISNVCWGRDQTWFNCEHTLIATDGLTVKYRQSKRYSLPNKLQHGDVSLTIKKAQNADTGFYVCRIEIPGLFNDLSYSFYLIITNGFDAINITNFLPTSAEKHTQEITVNSGYSSAVQKADSEGGVETFILTVVRVGAIIFIPGLIFALIWKLRRFRKREDGSEMENTPDTTTAEASPIHTRL